MPFLFLLLLLALNDVAAFIPVRQTEFISLPSSSTNLQAKKQKHKSKSSGGGFGSKPAAVTSTAPVSADKSALETQWDHFASITDLEILPPGDPDDDNYKHFIVSDVFVRVRPSEVNDENDKSGTGWYRTGKVVAADGVDMNAAFALQKGLIFWTAVHMLPQIAAKGTKELAKRLELGFLPPTLNMADETDTALDEEEAKHVQIPQRVSIQGVALKEIGFRPDFNPPGFTYRRREKAAMKKKRSALDEIVDAS